MKIKQLAGIIIAALVFVIVTVTGIYVNNLTDKKTDTLGLFGGKTSEITQTPLTDYIGLIRIEGTIMSEESGASVLGYSSGYSHKKVMSDIEMYMNDSMNKGIALYINSPGGVVYDVDELYLKLKEYKDTTGRPVYAYFGQYACSGGYYAAMAADKIYANRNSVTGSIGVILSLYDMTELYEKIGIKEIDIVSGGNKAMGSSGVSLTEEQKAIYQSQVDESFEQFTGIVSEGRNMSIDEVKALADGRTYTANQALSNGLIDGICLYEEFEDTIKNEMGDSITVYENKSGSLSGLYDWLFKAAAKVTNAEKNTEYEETIEKLKSLRRSGNGVLMYYAEP